MYIELFLLDNTLMNILMLRIAAAVCSIKLPAWRMALAAALGAVFAAFALGCALLLTLPFKLITGLLMALALPFNSIRSYMFNALAVFLAAFVTGGITICLAYCGGTLQNGMAIVSLPVRIALMAAVAATVMPTAMRKLFARSGLGCRGVLHIRHCGKEYSLTAIVDTGNSLYEPISGLPVTVVFQPELMKFATIPIPVASLGGKRILYAFMPERLQFELKSTVTLNSFLAVSEEPLCGVSAIVPPAAIPA
ncbi:MAG: sigma-E processing peptidase SpoIIGA [Clostridia bacterium]